jgi:hypothetical protein
MNWKNVNSPRYFFASAVLVVLMIHSSISCLYASAPPEQELSTGAIVSLPLLLYYAEYGFGPLAFGGGASYCIDAIKGQSFGYDVSTKVYLVPGYLYIKAGYGIAGLETGGHLGSSQRPLYGAEVLGGGRILIGEDSPYFFSPLKRGPR